MLKASENLVHNNQSELQQVLEGERFMLVKQLLKRLFIHLCCPELEQTVTSRSQSDLKST